MIEIGERMSKATDMDTLVDDERGDVYDGRANFLQHKPLDIGRLLYVKLRRRLQPEIGEEVWWDHFANFLTIEVRQDEDVYRTTFPVYVMPRKLTLDMVDMIIERVEKEVKKWQ